MRSAPPPLLPIFRSRHQANLLTYLYLHPHEEYTLSELAAQVEVPVSTLQREVGRLMEAGLATGRRIGRSHLVRANASNRYFEPLTALLTLAFGPHVLIEEEFGPLADVEAVAIFGSWASRYQGKPGPPPHDIDVAVIGCPSRTAMYEAAERVERQLRIPVNPVLITRNRWQAATDPLVKQVRSSPVVWVKESPDEIK